MFNDVYDVIRRYVYLSIIRCIMVACRKRPLDRYFSVGFVNFEMVLRWKKNLDLFLCIRLLSLFQCSVAISPKNVA